MNLLEIIKDLQDVINTSALRVADEVILENAIKLYISDNINKQKKENINSFKKPITEFKRLGIDTPASDKQINFLKKLGYKGDLNITKKEAYNKIQEIEQRGTQ